MSDPARRNKKRFALSVGEAVRFIRELRDMSQEQLATLADIPQPAIAAIENDRIPLGHRQARALAVALCCHPGILLFPDWGFVRPAAVEWKAAEPQRRPRHRSSGNGRIGEQEAAGPLI